MSSSSHSSTPTGRREPTPPAVIAPSRWIVYRNIHSACGGPFLTIFAAVDIAVYEHTLHTALRDSCSWAELRVRLPVGAWPQIKEMVDDPDADEEDRIRWDKDTAPYAISQIPDAEYGDYPPVRSEWLGELEGFMEALERAYTEVTLAAPYREVHWQVPPELAEDVAARLRQWGHVVERTDFLEFS